VIGAVREGPGEERRPGEEDPVAACPPSRDRRPARGGGVSRTTVGAGTRAALTAAALGVVLLGGALAIRPLNANDLFWHLGSGREILRTGAVPRTDPFSFASDPVPWVDHEWLWQAGAQKIYVSASGGKPGSGNAQAPSGPPEQTGSWALILSGAAIVAAAFALGARVMGREGAPPAAVALVGLLAAEAARERLMVRPETASLLFLALFLTVLPKARSAAARGSWRDALAPGFALAAITTVWSNVHPASLLAPGIVALDAAGSRWGSPGTPSTAEGMEAHAKRAPFGAWAACVALVGALAGAATLVNPYGWRLWTVPFKLSALVETKAFYNPEWLRPPPAVFPLFYAALALAVLAALASAARRRALPEGSLLVALALGALACRQMRHMGLFAMALLFAGAAVARALSGPEAAPIARALSRPLVSAAAIGGVLLSAALALVSGGREALADPLDRGRFPVTACERIAREAPGLTLFNDVQFGGYLIWRFHPPGRVFIDGRNELYESLLTRLGRIQTGEVPHEEWKRLLSEKGVDGALVKDKGEGGMVTFRLLPSSPGEGPRTVRRAFSAVYFPIAEWALVWFDDTAMVFVRRGGAGESWRAKGEYRVLNPEDASFVLDKAAHDSAFAALAIEEATRRVNEAPRCTKAEWLLSALRDAARAVPTPSSSH
jgi:hypothetical protein